MYNRDDVILKKFMDKKIRFLSSEKNTGDLFQKIIHPLKRLLKKINFIEFVNIGMKSTKI